MVAVDDALVIITSLDGATIPSAVSPAADVVPSPTSAPTPSHIPGPAFAPGSALGQDADQAAIQPSRSSQLNSLGSLEVLSDSPVVRPLAPWMDD